MRLKTIVMTAALIFAANLAVPAQTHQAQPTTTAQTQSSRDSTREKLRTLLAETGPKIDVAFRQSDKEPYLFSGIMKTGLANADSFEIVILVGDQETLHFRIFPKYKGVYVNVNKAADSVGLLRKMVRLSDTNFIYWGADESFDVFAGYNFTLESGFPTASVNVVLNSIKNLDQYVGQMKSSIDAN